ncbi:MAG: calcium/sodium antiporter [Gammaproteobacteria bacterium]|nr:calcium/sodium antiporter [Gammaproteobacteria bacterium]
MMLSYLAIIIGFVLLVWGADKFVEGASATAANLGVSPLIIGLTIVGFGTSAPEMLVSLMAALNGNPTLAVGNAIGSNITNIGLVLGVTALIVPLSVKSVTLKREYPIMFVIMLIVWYLIFDNNLNQMDGWLLVILMFLTLGLITYLGFKDQKGPKDPIIKEFENEIPQGMSMSQAIFWLMLGMAILLFSSKILVWGAVNIAQEFGVSDLVIGLTIIAIGTSLPELAASIAGALKGEHDIVIGNIIGSNIFNLLGVLGIPAIVAPIAELPETVLSRDYLLMIALSVALFFVAFGFNGKGTIKRYEGLLLLASYIFYMISIFFSI